MSKFKDFWKSKVALTSQALERANGLISYESKTEDTKSLVEDGFTGAEAEELVKELWDRQTNKSRIEKETNEEYFEYLDKLRESGVTNMFGAAAYLQEEFGLGREDAKRILLVWMHTFGERHPQKSQVEKGMIDWICPNCEYKTQVSDTYDTKICPKCGTESAVKSQVKKAWFTDEQIIEILKDHFLPNLEQGKDFKTLDDVVRKLEQYGASEERARHLIYLARGGDKSNKSQVKKATNNPQYKIGDTVKYREQKFRVIEVSTHSGDREKWVYGLLLEPHGQIKADDIPEEKISKFHVTKSVTDENNQEWFIIYTPKGKDSTGREEIENISTYSEALYEAKKLKEQGATSIYIDYVNEHGDTQMGELYKHSDSQITKADWVGMMMEFEEGNLNESDTIKLFQHLVDSGQAWHLQGFYGRTANELLDAGVIKPPKDKGGKDAYGNPLKPYYDSKKKSQVSKEYEDKKKLVDNYQGVHIFVATNDYGEKVYIAPSINDWLEEKGMPTEFKTIQGAKGAIHEELAENY